MTTSALAILLAVSSALFHAIVGLISKSADDILVRRAVQETTPGLIGLAMTPFVPLPEGNVWWILLLTGCVHFVYQIMQVNAYRLGDFSIVYPISRGLAPLIAAFGAILFLGEDLNLWGWIALCVISLGLIAFAFDGHKNKTDAHIHGPALGFAAATAAMVAAYTVVDANGMRAVPDPLTFVAWMFIANGIGITIASILWRGRQFLPAFQREWKSGAVAGTISLFGYGIFLYALRIGDVARMASLRETSVIFGALFGVYLLKEPFGLIRVFAALTVVGGVMALHLT